MNKEAAGKRKKKIARRAKGKKKTRERRKPLPLFMFRRQTSK